MTGDGLLEVQLGGAAYDPPPDLAPLTRASFGRLMDRLHDQLGGPFTVDVVEADGTRATGVIDLPGRPGPGETQAADPFPAVSGWEAPLAAGAGGFLPGEDVLVCFAHYCAQAGPDGQAIFGLPAGYAGREMVLLGRASGTLAVRRAGDAP
ncbi:MAG: hypothetical protein LBK95_21250 [Bifidobacteriaceae bacterium]|nr:hypothetical protein [Bifidobacteriaceae bacterium]